VCVCVCVVVVVTVVGFVLVSMQSFSPIMASNRFHVFAIS